MRATLKNTQPLYTVTTKGVLTASVNRPVLPTRETVTAPIVSVGISEARAQEIAKNEAQEIIDKDNERDDNTYMQYSTTQW